MEGKAARARSGDGKSKQTNKKRVMRHHVGIEENSKHNWE